MCESVQIEAQAFCTGLKILDVSAMKNIGLQGLIAPALYLMRGAISRPKCGWSDEKSLRLRPLGELIDMFHSHKAYKLRDRVYALLGMSTDGYNANDEAGKSRIFPDYRTPWNIVMDNVIRFTLSREVDVEAAVDHPVAGILAKGITLGIVQSVSDDNAWNDTITVQIDLPSSLSDLNGLKEPNMADSHTWTLPAPAKSLRSGDLILVIAGSKKATIVRPQKDHFDILMISAIDVETLFLGWIGEFRCTLPLRDFVLVW